MPEFLSPDWIDALDQQLLSAGPGSSAQRLTVQYVIDDGDAEPVEYHLTLGPTGDRAVPGRAEAPDVTFMMSTAVAARISAGTLGTEEAFVTGLLTLHGDATLLMEAHQHRRDA